MGLEGSALWNTIEQVAREEGVVLFDVELPADTRRGGTLKVFITKPKSLVVTEELPPEVVADDEDGGDLIDRGGISFEECVRVSKRILDIDEQSELIPGNCTLEVSSPGINRKLRLPEHFIGAVGERVKIKFRNVATAVVTVVNGYIRTASDDSVTVEAESGKESFQIPLSEVKEARVDFKF